MSGDEAIKQRIDVLERDIKEFKAEMKGMNERIRNTELSVSKIEIMMDQMSHDWKELKIQLDRLILNQSQGWPKITIEILKWSILIIGSLLGIKMVI
ncbi:hypothetical protein [Chengkuizengella axinellae]|uniref:DUF1640 domain-containing protein n=1 Tax=Chengkuizengella axinellae TaxID=3064388 RepID=A0ABT9IW40_9BACL|nr:hypothetical protein [Chengkuizengella sp. 2205SS18-9]MDP5273562.1 hypothetical protein [Chengkuizengella sp. 2205SS18-9]